MATGDLIAAGVQSFFNEWRDLSVQESGRSLPLWDELSIEQTSAWSLAFAATVEVSARMGVAVVMTLEDSRGH